MEIYYSQRRLQKQCSTYSEAVKQWGPQNAKRLFMRIQQLTAARCLEEMYKVPGARFHPLTQNRLGQFAMDLKHPLRLIVVPHGLIPRKTDGSIDLSRVTSVTIIEVEDYHG